jgi:hypothetical protein
MRRLEKSEELKFVRYVRSRKWKCIKLSTAGFYGERGHSDRMVLAPRRIVEFFEFKREGEVPEPLQRVRHKELSNMGFKVHVVYTAESAIRILLKIVCSQTVSKGVHSIRRQ